MRHPRNPIIGYTLLLVLALSFRVAVAYFLPNDDPFDGKIYAQMARNLLEQHVYSHATAPPYEPSLIRLPGYPLFLAGVYSVFGHENNTAVRVIQAVVDTATCVLIGLIAFYWEPEAARKHQAATIALALAAICPFTTIYVATILTETWATFFMIALCLSTTLAFNARRLRTTVWLWAMTGAVAGLAILFRPDSGLFAAAVGITLVVTEFFGRPPAAGESVSARSRLLKTTYLGLVYSATFCLVLLPWTIRNKHVFHLFQPLAPAHAEMPGEFVPHGYLSWLRTWVDDERYIGPVLWSLDELPINVKDFPDRAFDSEQEKQRVADLLEKYNHPADGQPSGPPDTESQPGDLHPEQATPESNTPEEPETDEPETEGGSAPSEGESTDLAEEQSVAMTPEIDAGFRQIARERISHSAFRYYVELPVKRAISMWFDTHSQYYPFEGELFPLSDLDEQEYQHLWLPLFTGLTLIYTLFGIAGASFLWMSSQEGTRRWVLLVVLMIFLRLGFFASLENPEPRYVVELFPLLSILSGIAFPRLLRKK